MKKRLIFLTLILINLTFCTKKTAPQTDWEKLSLKGKVKSLRETNFLADSASTIVGAILTFHFSPDGFKTFEEWSDLQEGISRIDYEYDKQNRLLFERKFSPEGDETSRVEYIYEGENLKKLKIFSGENLETISENFYNNKNQISACKDFDENGNLISKNEFLYNSDGKISQDTWFEKDEKTFWRQTFSYDKNGVLTRDEWSNNDGFCWRWEFSCDENLNRTDAICYADNGQILERWHYEYLYDKRGNWNEKTTFEGEALKKKIFTERKIEYYD